MRRVIAAAALLSGLLITNVIAQTSTGPDVTSRSGSSSMKMSQIDCDAAWIQLDSGNTGTASQTQAQALISDFKTADVNADGKLSQLEFRQACDNGLVNSAATTGPAGGTGAGAGTGSGTSPSGSNIGTTTK
jgi:hypothetical protein